MKKCPFCHADIEDNARFCVFCMSPLQEKQKIENQQKDNKRWLYILAAFLLLALAFAITIFALSKNEANNNSSESSMQSETTPANNSSYTNNILSSDNTSDDVSKNTATDNSSKADTEDNNSNGTVTEPESSGNKTPSASSSQGSDASGSSSSTPSTTPSQSQPQQSNLDSTTDSDDQSSTDTPTQNEVTYIYRTAKYGDDYSVAYKGSEDDIVITGVATVSESGVYVIPEQIDGKRVIAIMPLAFCGDNISDTVKKIVVPSSVKTIWDRAFVICYNLTDIYFCGNSLYTYPSAFADTSKRTGTLTIHSAPDCSNRDLRYYKNIANSFYGAQYKEWNGGEIG